MTVTRLKTVRKVRQSYSLRSKGKTLLNTPYRHVAEQCGQMMFSDFRSVSMIDNATGKTVQLFVYGRAQK